MTMMIGARQWNGGAESAGSFIDLVLRYGNATATWTEPHDADPGGGYPAEPVECIRIRDESGTRRMLPGDWLGLVDTGAPGEFVGSVVVLRPVESTPVPARDACTTCSHRPSFHQLPKGFTGTPYDRDALYGCVGPDGTGCDAQCPNFTGDAMFVAGRLVDGS